MNLSAARRILHRYRRLNWALADQSVISLANFITVFLLARRMEIEQFGAFVVALTAIRFVTTVENTLVTGPHNVIGAKREGVAYRTYTGFLGLLNLGGSLGVGLLLLAGGVLFEGLGLAHGGMLIFTGLTLPAWTAQEFVRRVLYTRVRSFQAFLNDSFCYGMQVAGIIWLVWGSNRPGPEDPLVVLGLSSFLAVLMGLIQIRGDVIIERNAYALPAVREMWRETWGFAKWLLSAAFLQWFGVYGHTWLLAAILGAGAVGSYQAAAQLVNVLNPIRQAANAYLPSRAAVVLKSLDISGLRRWLRRVVLSLGSAYFFGALILSILAYPLLGLAYGDKYLGMGLEWVVVLASISYLVNGMRAPLQVGIMAMERSRPLFHAGLISSVLVVSLGAGLIYAYGILGAPVAQILIGAVLLAVLARAFARLSSSLEGLGPTLPHEHAGPSRVTSGA